MSGTFRVETALITGASSGLGAEFVRQLAPKVRRLHLVARREDRLLLLRAESMAACPNLESVEIHAVDLGDEEARARLLDAVGGTVDLLINNAGMGDYGAFDDSDWPKVRAMMELNMTALVHLSHGVLAGMKARKKGGIVNISSLASMLFIPDFAVYAATKAFVTQFSEALRLEARGDGVAVVAVCPGPVPTEFGQQARRAGEKRTEIPSYGFFYATPQQVVAEALEALERGRALVFPSLKVRLAAWLLRSMPRLALRAILAGRPRKSTKVSAAS